MHAGRSQVEKAKTRRATLKPVLTFSGSICPMSVEGLHYAEFGLFWNLAQETWQMDVAEGRHRLRPGASFSGHLRSTPAAPKRPPCTIRHWPLDLHRQAGKVEAVRLRQLVEVGELLDLPVFRLDAGEVRRPDVLAVAGAPVVGDHVGERPVQRVGIDADHAHALLDEPQDTFPSQARLREVVRRAEPLVGPGVQEHDVQRPQATADALEGRFQVSDGDEVPRSLMANIEHDARREAPFQRHLVDGSRRLAFGQGAVVVGGIDVGDSVRHRLHFLDSPAQAIGPDEVLRPHAEEVLHLLEALAVVPDIINLRGQRLAGGVVVQGHAQVDQAAVAAHPS
jgi:hypothetical protein